MTFRTDFVAGFRDVAAMLFPLFALGTVVGVAAAEAGIPTPQTIGMAVLFFSPLSMITTIELIEAGVPPAIIVITAISVVIHFIVLSFSIAPSLSQVSRGWRWVLAYFLNTPTFAFAVQRYEAYPDTSIRGYLLGIVLPFWIVWQASVLTGVVLGVSVPSEWELDFVITLVFIALLGRMVTHRTAVIAIGVAGFISVIAVGLPFNVGILIAALVGTATGAIYRRMAVGV